MQHHNQWRKIKTNLTLIDTFRYLGILLSEDGRNNKEILARIAQAKGNFQK